MKLSLLRSDCDLVAARIDNRLHVVREMLDDGKKDLKVSVHSPHLWIGVGTALGVAVLLGRGHWLRPLQRLGRRAGRWYRQAQALAPTFTTTLKASLLAWGLSKLGLTAGSQASEP